MSDKSVYRTAPNSPGLLISWGRCTFWEKGKTVFQFTLLESHTAAKRGKADKLFMILRYKRTADLARQFWKALIGKTKLALNT